MHYQWISRLLGNDLIGVDTVMAPFAHDVLARSAANGQSLVVMIDQSKVNDAHQMVMVSLRLGERALPLAWRMKKTQGAIGFADYRMALEAVAALLPAGARVMLMGDRFYGSPALICWCRAKGWGGGCASSGTCWCSRTVGKRRWRNVSRAASTCCAILN